MRHRNFKDPQYVEWRKKVFGRDRYRCQMPGCTGRGKALNAHHIRRWANYPALRFELSNGITLCRQCHKLVSGREEAYENRFRNIVNGKSGGTSIVARLVFMRYAEEMREDLHGNP